jgi:ABC-type antimicrobial peptide transport system permease subunit
MRKVTNLDLVTIAAEQAGEASRIASEVTPLLRKRHALAANLPDDFSIRTEAAKALTKGLYTSAAVFVLANLPQLDQITLEEMAGTLQQTSSTLTALLASIAAISLIVGGIGIMNIMLVSVTERTREIGLRMAVGARGRDVLIQFLIEALTLSVVGGLVGVALGFVAAGVVTRMLEWQTVVSASAVAMAFGTALATGVFFGFYPARRASQLDPIDALRFE